MSNEELQKIDDDLLKKRRANSKSAAELPPLSEFLRMTENNKDLLSPRHKKSFKSLQSQNSVFKMQSKKRVRYSNLQAFECEITGVRPSPKALTKPVSSAQKRAMSMQAPAMRGMGARAGRSR